MNTGSDAQNTHAAPKMSQQDRVSYARRIEQARNAMGLTQQQLADMSDTSRGTIGNIESGKTVPQSDVLWRIMGALEMRHDMDPQWSAEVQRWLSIIAPLLEQMSAEVRERAMQEVLSILAAAVRPAETSPSNVRAFPARASEPEATFLSDDELHGLGVADAADEAGDWQAEDEGREDQP
jgi:transcriptional regulator with XRE-family HTH domain